MNKKFRWGFYSMKKDAQPQRRHPLSLPPLSETDWTANSEPQEWTVMDLKLYFKNHNDLDWCYARLSDDINADIASEREKVTALQGFAEKARLYEKQFDAERERRRESQDGWDECVVLLNEEHGVVSKLVGALEEIIRMDGCNPVWTSTRIAKSALESVKDGQ